MFTWSLLRLQRRYHAPLTLTQAGLLACGSTYFPPLPMHHTGHSGYGGFRPRLQRRAHSRLSRDSPLSLAAPGSFSLSVNLINKSNKGLSMSFIGVCSLTGSATYGSDSTWTGIMEEVFSLFWDYRIYAYARF